MTSQTISIRECEAVIDLLPQLWPDQTLDRRMLAETFQAAMNSPRQKYVCATLESKDSAFHRRDAHRFYEQMGFERRAYLFSKELGRA